VAQVKHSASYTIDRKSHPPERFQLAPGQSVKVRVTFRAPPGEYLIVGYGGGVQEEKSLTSNAISFDVNDGGIATFAKPEM